MASWISELKSNLVVPYPGQIVGVAGPNEPDNQGFTYTNGVGGPTGAQGTAGGNAAQPALYAAMKADPALSGIPVDQWPSAFSFSGNFAGNYPNMVDLTGSTDRCNLHDYYSADQTNQPTFPADGPIYNALNDPSHGYLANNGQFCHHARYVTTETGWFTPWSSGGQTYTSITDEYTQARLILDDFFDHASKTSNELIYIYNLRGTNYYGVMKDDGTPKASATAIKNLMTILQDTGSNAATFTPDTLAYSLSGMPSQGGNTVIEKSNRAHDILLWNETPAFNASTGADIAVTPSAVTLTLPPGSSGSVYNPIGGAAPISTFSNIASVNVSLGDAPLIVEVGSATASISANPATIPNGGSSSPLPALLTWTSTNATSCAGTGFSTGGAASGSVSVSPTTTTSYSVTCGGAPASATVTVAGTLINAATAYCAANGGGNGSAGSPWQAACIQAAHTAATKGDTIFLQAGNWALSTAASPVIFTKAVNLVGAGSGNTFNVYGNPSNANGTDLCPSTSITCIATVGTSTTSGTGGWLQYSGCGVSDSNGSGPVAIAHIFIDGSLVTAGGDASGTVNFRGCSGSPESIDVNDIRVLGFNNSPFSEEAQFSFDSSNNITMENSVFAAPLYVGGGGLCAVPPIFVVVSTGLTINNSYFFEAGIPPIDVDNFVLNGSTVIQGDDGSGNTFGTLNSIGVPGCGIGPGAGCPNGGHNGTYNIAFTNNYMQANGQPFGVGGGLNDPGTGGGINALTFTGNTIVGGRTALDSCVWHYYDYTIPNNPYDPNNANMPYYRCAPGSIGGGSEGMQINGTVQSDCTQSATPSAGFAVTNNNITGVTSAALNAAGTGAIRCLLAPVTGHLASNNIISSISSMVGIVIGTLVTDENNPGAIPSNTTVTAVNGACGTNCVTLSANTTTTSTDTLDFRVLHDNSVVNFNAQKNYMNSPHNLYLSSKASLNETINPTVINNYCTGGTAFTQTDATTCATSGFTTPPTCSFTIGTMSGSTVPFASTIFTAQYGTVQWLASTLSTAPTSGGQAGGNSWGLVPPVSLTSVSHGDTVYMWVMDSVNHISSCGSSFVG
jgi:hypothetical protein